MPVLPNNPTLRDFQTYVKQLEAERGFADQLASDKCLLLQDELAELFDAVRRQSQMPSEACICEDKDGVGAELADVFIFILCIANRFGVDLEIAFRAKEDINKKRDWRQ